jgi:hypothetical protein
MKYCRIDLDQTNYKKLENSRYIIHDRAFLDCSEIYQTYCRYKQFESVMPLFSQQFKDPWTEIIGYYDNHNLVAFSLIKLHDLKNAEALQFAWNYSNPKLRLGITSLKHECAIYKERGYRYLYLGQADDYKSQIDGFEILGKI